MIRIGTSTTLLVLVATVALTGRAIQLHPVIEQTFRAVLAEQKIPASMVAVKISQPHVAAARVAASPYSALTANR